MPSSVLLLRLLACAWYGALHADLTYASGLEQAMMEQAIMGDVAAAVAAA